jgi:hypothetical protein
MRHGYPERAMTNRKRRSTDRGTQPDAVEPLVGTPPWVGQIGLYETGNGLPQGPGAIVLAVAIAVVVYPVVRFARYLARR